MNRIRHNEGGLTVAVLNVEKDAVLRPYIEDYYALLSKINYSLNISAL
jgi:hypothetical protein